MPSATFDPHGATPVHVGDRLTTLAKLCYWHDAYTFAESGTVATVDNEAVSLPAGSIAHCGIQGAGRAAILTYWIETPAGQMIEDFPFYRIG
jgi:hypothetical protein